MVMQYDQDFLAAIEDWCNSILMFGNGYPHDITRMCGMHVLCQMESDG